VVALYRRLRILVFAKFNIHVTILILMTNLMCILTANPILSRELKWPAFLGKCRACLETGKQTLGGRGEIDKITTHLCLIQKIGTDRGCRGVWRRIPLFGHKYREEVIAV
jgi:hypothetical protein